MKLTSVLEEKSLLGRLKRKDKEAFIRAYDLYTDHIYRFIYFKVSDAHEAQDLTSMVFLKAWNHIQTKSLTDAKTLKALIYKIARNVIVDHYREKNKLNPVSLDIPENEIDVIDEGQDPAKEVEIAYDFSLIEKKLKDLKDEYCEVIILRFIEELSISEIADILNKTKGNVRILTYRALKALRELMEKENNRQAD